MSAIKLFKPNMAPAGLISAPSSLDSPLPPLPISTPIPILFGPSLPSPQLQTPLRSRSCGSPPRVPTTAPDPAALSLDAPPPNRVVRDFSAVGHSSAVVSVSVDLGDDFPSGAAIAKVEQS